MGAPGKESDLSHLDRFVIELIGSFAQDKIRIVGARDLSTGYLSRIIFRVWVKPGASSA